MELRQTEESLQEIQRLYESIRISPLLAREDPPVELPPCPTTALAPASHHDNANNNIVSLQDSSNLVQTLKQIQTTLPTLETKMERFRQRLAEKDAVTGQPRYGAKTQGRVQAFLTLYDFFLETIPLLSKDDNENSNELKTNENNDTETSTSPSILFLSQIEQRHEQQQLEQLSLQQAQEQAARLQQEQDRQKQLLAQQQHAQQMAEQERLEQERKEAEAAALRQQAQAARERRRALEQAERDWVQQIPKGPDGVRQQIVLLKESIQQAYQSADSSNDADPLLQQLEQQQALETAITSLTTIFRQIHARPEDTNLRRIRRDHPQFQQDIGRFKGGVELLIAAGFELGHIDEVPVYLSKEPNLETDMDAWTVWFDRIKSTLEILEDESSRL
eukprot:Nitzschia sp. Nitz4//scaffold104_size75438//59071//60240//NITZ4_005665-RA/size75438-processed-gene-0.50-mRNA-1//-1//CDS//3329532413//4316//frame0